MKTTPLPWTILIVAALTLGCSQTGTPVPPLQPQVSPPQSPPGPVEFPPLTKAGRVFGSPVQLTYPLQRWTLASRFVLFDDGTFELQYGDAGNGVAFQYPGRYSEINAEVRLMFGSDPATPNDTAIGTLIEDKLTVRYSINMNMSDFEDAVYTLVR